MARGLTLDVDQARASDVLKGGSGGLLIETPGLATRDEQAQQGVQAADSPGSSGDEVVMTVSQQPQYGAVVLGSDGPQSAVT
jgi:hypothetical protein